MRLSALALLISIFCYCSAVWANTASLEVTKIACTSTGTHTAICTIETKGSVSNGDRLALLHVYDKDELYFQEAKLGQTGNIFGLDFYARWLPRLYSLDALKGQKDPTFQIKAQSLLGPGAGLFEKSRVEILSQGESARKYLKPFFTKILHFLFFLLFLGYAPTWFLQKQRDGWTWNQKAHQIFFLSCIFINLALSEIPRVVIPTLVPGDKFFYLQALLSLVFTWSLSVLLASMRFTDLSSLEKFHSKASQQEKYFYPVIHASLVLGFATLLYFGNSGFKQAQSSALLLQSLPLAALVAWKFYSFEWRRAWKRSRFLSFLYVGSLLVLGAISVYASLRYFFSRESYSPALIFASSLSLVLGTLRTEYYRKLYSRAQSFVRDLRLRLANTSAPKERLQLICTAIEEEWTAARVSIVSVKGEYGLVLASAGEDALEIKEEEQARKLGPFLKRVLREKHFLYAPVAEELGRDLVAHGMKHSSMAFPIFQGENVESVLCIMAEEEERISPENALALEIASSQLSLEISLACAHAIAESKEQQLRQITSLSSGIVLENLDDWGRMGRTPGTQRRIVVSADCVNSTLLAEHAALSPALRNSLEKFKLELYTQWFALRSSFEFISKDVRGDDFWALSPKEFKNPLLRMLGEEKAAVALAYLLDKSARQICRQPEFRWLACAGARVAVGAGPLRYLSLGLKNSKCLDIDAPLLSRLHRIRSLAEPGSPLLDLGDEKFALAVAEEKAFHLKKKYLEPSEGEKLRGLQQLPEITTLLWISADKKEFRKLELLAEELLREQRKKNENSLEFAA